MGKWEGGYGVLGECREESLSVKSVDQIFECVAVAEVVSYTLKLCAPQSPFII